MKNRIGYNIYILRKKRRLTQSQLAELCGMYQQNIARIESGKVIPSYDLAERIISTLGAELTIKEA